jgi:cytochrome c biogenesis protein CcdA
MITPFSSAHDTATIKEEQFKKLSFANVFAAGLADASQLCALAAIMFIVSFLVLIGGTPRQTFAVGGIFVLAVFASLMILGIAFFNFARIVLRDPTLAIIINLILLLFVGALAVFAIIDFARYLKGGAGDAAIRLPKFGNVELREKIRDFTENKLTLYGMTFLVGIVIAGTGLVCAGQVYLPLVTMISEPRTRIMATAYLFSYNLAFIIPLVFVFLLALIFTSKQVRNICVKNVVFVKFGAFLLFLVMAVAIFINLRLL